MATTSRPLLATLSLSNFTTKINSDSPKPAYDDADIFDRLDRLRSDYSIDEGVSLDERSSTPAPRDAHSAAMNWNQALSDTTSTLFPSLPPSTLYTRSSTSAEEPPPRWLRSTSSRVTALSASRISLAAFTNDTSMTNDEMADNGMISRDNLRSGPEVVRIAVGCEDGSLWIFAPTADSMEEGGGDDVDETGESNRGRNGPLAVNIPTDSPHTRSISATPAPRSGSTSPVVSATARAIAGYPNKPFRPPNGPLLSPSLSTISTNSAVRISSMNSVSSFSSARPGSDTPASNQSRSRKASATISISTGSPQMNPDQFNDTDPATPSSSTNSTFPSIIGKSFSLNEPPARRRSSSQHYHSRGKESITSGLGLWEHQLQHHASSIYDELVSPTLAENGDLQEKIPVIWKERELEKLEPIIKICLAGGGEIVKISFVEGLRFGRDEGGRVLVCLKRSGQLFIHSIIDGRLLASCHAGGKVATSSKANNIAFDGFEIVPLADSTTAVCYSSHIGFVTIDLDSMEVEAPLENQCETVGPAIVFKQGVFFILSCQASAYETTDLIVRPITLEEDDSQRFRATIKSPSNAGPLPGISRSIKGIRSCADDLLAFDDEGVLLCTIRDQKVAPLARLDLVGVTDICVQGYGAILMTSRDWIRTYKLIPSLDQSTGYFKFELVEEHPISASEHSCMLPLSALSPLSSFITASFSLDTSSRYSSSIALRRSSSSSSPNFGDKDERTFRCLYSSVPFDRKDTVESITTSTYLDIEQVILGYNTGQICVARYSDMASLTELMSIASAQLSGSITIIKVLDYLNRKIVVAGSTHGEGGAWNISDWSEIGRWNLFASPVSDIVSLCEAMGPSFRHSIAFISSDSPVAIISLAVSGSIFVLPGTTSLVSSISTATSGDELLIIYDSGLARISDAATMELRRSMDLKTATGLINDGGWETWFDSHDLIPSVSTASDALLSLDLRTIVDTASNYLPWRESGSGTPNDGAETELRDLIADSKLSRGDHLGSVRLLLSRYATFGVDSACDHALVEHLEIVKPNESPDSYLSSPESTATLLVGDPFHSWRQSPSVTSQRLLTIICLLRVFLNFPDTERYATEAIAFYASSLATAVGSSFAFPSLAHFALYWLDKSTEVQQAARLLFLAYLDSAPHHNIVALAEEWQDLLPSRPKEMVSDNDDADLAVLIIGLIASDKFKLLSAGTLKDISLSISLYLVDNDHPTRQAIATELCARGFEIWQNYVDAMDLLRSLFALATGRNADIRPELKNLARQATLHVAAVNTPLFMTTLSFDILNAPSAIDRNSSLKLLGYMVRKKPLVLYTSLPRLAEAVVKSLDPTVTSLRETVQQAATVILNELVRTYPSIDFHAGSQRLAVGTHEGACIVYDLKTATRLYVLESHQHPITALSWAPDGRRLVTMSLDESKLVVWKVGVGIFSMFTTGAAPRQGSLGTGAATPFKTLDFNVGAEGLMTTSAALEWIKFEWPTERTARLKIRETALTFSV